jgi:hypothetical protein
MITQLYNSILNPDTPICQIVELKKFAQEGTFGTLAVEKNKRIIKVCDNLKDRIINRIYTSYNLTTLSAPGYSIEPLDRYFFREYSEEKASKLFGSLVIVGNNSLSDSEDREGYIQFFKECTSTLFISWDWDNHQWLDLSTFLATHSDIYAVSHPENLYLLSRYNWLIAGPVNCATIQWTSSFLTENLSEIIKVKRSNSPLGQHNSYDTFWFREYVISSVGRYYPDVRMNESPISYQTNSAEDRLSKWISHKSHWLMPVLNDIPIRIFDSLITGGIAIVPESLRFLPPIRDIPRDYIVFFTPKDIESPQRITEKANSLFDKGGVEGIITRHRYALLNHHADVRLQQILSFIYEVLGEDSGKSVE